MSSERAIQTIVVAGGGIVGLSAALAFKRALPNAAITLLETAQDPAALSDRSPVSLASGPAFHALIGLAESDLVRSGAATHFLGTEMGDWSASGEPWWHVIGAYGKGAGAIPFDQLWVAARRTGKTLPYDRYAVGAALARAGKFVLPATDPEFIGSRFGYGLRLDPEPYRNRLRKLAETVAIDFRNGDIAGVDRREDGFIEAVRVTDGTSLKADLFVDCSGPAARLATEMDGSFEDWSQWLPCGQLELTESDGPEVPSPADRIRADDGGWIAQWPLRGRIVTARVTPDGEDSSVALTRGRRLRPWTGNVLALGDAATALDPLHRLNLDMAHNAILLALELLPGRDFDPVETNEYNRRSEQVTRRVRDFIALHYLRSGRSDGVWGEFSRIEPPDSLARTLDQFEERGRMPFHEEETITRDSWTAALLGLGVVPTHVDPQARVLPLNEVVAAMDRLAREIDEAVTSVPSYADYLSRLTG